MGEQAELLKQRTFSFAIGVVQAIKRFENDESARIVGRQLAKAATSVGANYRAACRARSHADFTSKIAIVAEEADECVYWLDVALAARLTESETLSKLQQEARELTAIFSRAVGTARLNAKSTRNR